MDTVGPPGGRSGSDPGLKRKMYYGRGPPSKSKKIKRGNKSKSWEKRKTVELNLCDFDDF